METAFTMIVIWEHQIFSDRNSFFLQNGCHLKSGLEQRRHEMISKIRSEKNHSPAQCGTAHSQMIILCKKREYFNLMKTNLSYICQILQLNEFKTKIQNKKQANIVRHSILRPQIQIFDSLKVKFHVRISCQLKLFYVRSINQYKILEIMQVAWVNSQLYSLTVIQKYLTTECD